MHTFCEELLNNDIDNGRVDNSSIMEKKWQKVLKVSWSKDELSQID